MEITNTITVLELIWTIVAAIGLVFSARLLWRSYTDMYWLIHENVNGDHDLRVYIALTSILIFSGGMITQLSYTIVAIIAMTQKSLGGHPQIPQIASSSIFITASTIGSIFAGLIYSRRAKIVKLVAKKLEDH